MMRKLIKNIVITLALVLVMYSGNAYAMVILNEHNEMDCGKCHEGDVSFEAVPDSVKLVSNDIVSLCLTCHEDIINVHHPQRVQVMGDIPDYLPLADGDSIVCTTCHEIHFKDASMHLLRSDDIGYYTSRIEICYSCHKDDFKEISPHRSELLGLSCLTCHRDSPTIKDTRETVTLVDPNIEKICNFCHNIESGNHPLNVDTTIKLSDRLPFSKEGKVVCTTCHDPHGTVGTINFLRKQYVIDLEFGKYDNPHNVEEYFNCIKCHVEIPTVNEYINCRHKDDFILLCYNCHGADQEKCHIVNVSLSEGMVLPEKFLLNDDGLITCVTCHNPDCSQNKRIRYLNLDAITKTRCGDCHDYKASLAETDPHTGSAEVSDDCFYCHKIDAEMNDFTMNPKFICMKCHIYKEHPSDSRLDVVFSNAIPGIVLDKKGKITCVTCHDPHSTDTANFKLKVLENMTICEACHQ